MPFHADFTQFLIILYKFYQIFINFCMFLLDFFEKICARAAFFVTLARAKRKNNKSLLRICYFLSKFYKI